jgi:hypothetical protein
MDGILDGSKSGKRRERLRPPGLIGLVQAKSTVFRMERLDLGAYQIYLMLISKCWV